jgi:CheY-like chemotaxis protein
MYESIFPLPFSTEGERAVGKARVLSILCVYDNPMFLDRICRYLETEGDLSVDISISADDALHLMRYVLFDVIVTDYTLGQTTSNGFLKAVRDQGNPVPFIYFTRTRNADVEAEAGCYNPVSFVAWEGQSPARGFEDLCQAILLVAAEPGKRARSEIAVPKDMSQMGSKEE